MSVALQWARSQGWHGDECHPRKQGHGQAVWEQGADGRSVAGAGDRALLLTACPVCDPGAALRDRKAIAGQPPRERKLLLCIWRG